MKIKDLIIECADMLGMFDERVLLENINEENEFMALENAEIKKLFNLTKFSVRELCSNYLPVLASCEINVEEGKYPISNLVNCIRIHNIHKDHEEIDYKIINRTISVIENGIYTVEYFSYPEINSLFDEIDFLNNLNPDVIVFGLCAYYCLSCGLFDDFQEFHSKYIDRAESLKNMKIFNIPMRRWM